MKQACAAVAQAEGALGITFIAIGPIDRCSAPAVRRIKSTPLVCILQQVAFPRDNLWMMEVAMRRAVMCVGSFGMKGFRLGWERCVKVLRVRAHSENMGCMKGTVHGSPRGV